LVFWAYWNGRVDSLYFEPFELEILWMRYREIKRRLEDAWLDGHIRREYLILEHLKPLHRNNVE
jgi:hypothetical protein